MNSELAPLWEAFQDKAKDFLSFIQSLPEDLQAKAVEEFDMIAEVKGKNEAKLNKAVPSSVGQKTRSGRVVKVKVQFGEETPSSRHKTPVSPPVKGKQRGRPRKSLGKPDETRVKKEVIDPEDESPILTEGGGADPTPGISRIRTGSGLGRRSGVIPTTTTGGADNLEASSPGSSFAKGGTSVPDVPETKRTKSSILPKVWLQTSGRMKNHGIQSDVTTASAKTQNSAKRKSNSNQGSAGASPKYARKGVQGDLVVAAPVRKRARSETNSVVYGNIEIIASTSQTTALPNKLQAVTALHNDVTKSPAVKQKSKDVSVAIKAITDARISHLDSLRRSSRRTTESGADAAGPESPAVRIPTRRISGRQQHDGQDAEPVSIHGKAVLGTAIPSQESTPGYRVRRGVPPKDVLDDLSQAASGSPGKKPGRRPVGRPRKDARSRVAKQKTAGLGSPVGVAPSFDQRKNYDSHTTDSLVSPSGDSCKHNVGHPDVSDEPVADSNRTKYSDEAEFGGATTDREPEIIRDRLPKDSVPYTPVSIQANVNLGLIPTAISGTPSPDEEGVILRLGPGCLPSNNPPQEEESVAQTEIGEVSEYDVSDNSAPDSEQPVDDVTSSADQTWQPRSSGGCQVARNNRRDVTKTAASGRAPGRKHRKTEHSLLTCPEVGCERTFYTRVDQRLHLKAHLRHDLKCHMCGRKSKYQFKFDQHLKLHAERQLIKCPHCANLILGQDRLTRHIQEVHFEGKGSRKKWYACAECPQYKFRSLQKLRQHCADCHEKSNHICELCGKRFLYSAKMRAHMQAHEDGSILTCQFEGCGFTADDEQVMERHLIRKHQREEDRPLGCELCSKRFFEEKYLKLHMQVYHSENTAYVCELCQCRTKTLYALKQHKSTEHPDKSVICEVCGATFKEKSTLKDHVKRHFGEKNYKCPMCDKMFASPARVAAHKKWHLDPEFPCDKCGRAFITKSKLAAHMLIHLDLKPHKCPYCNYSCRLKSNLYKHTENVHNTVHPEKHSRYRYVNKLYGQEPGPLKPPAGRKSKSSRARPRRQEVFEDTQAAQTLAFMQRSVGGDVQTVVLEGNDVVEMVGVVQDVMVAPAESHVLWTESCGQTHLEVGGVDVGVSGVVVGEGDGAGDIEIMPNVVEVMAGQDKGLVGGQSEEVMAGMMEVGVVGVEVGVGAEEEEQAAGVMPHHMVVGAMAGQAADDIASMLDVSLEGGQEGGEGDSGVVGGGGGAPEAALQGRLVMIKPEDGQQGSPEGQCAQEVGQVVIFQIQDASGKPTYAIKADGQDGGGERLIPVEPGTLLLSESGAVMQVV